MIMSKSERILAFVVVALAPLAVYALTLLQPTFDDWTYLTYPNEDPHRMKYFMPYGDYWRPIDALVGYVVATDLRLFPALNHILVAIGHLAGACMVWLLGRRMTLSAPSRIVATLFFLLSPAMLGTVLGIDSINQVFSSTLGLIALWAYLGHSAARLWLWAVMGVIATFAKENGMMWLPIAPLLGYAFRMTDRKTLLRHLAVAAGIIAAYLLIRHSLPHYNIQENNVYAVGGMMPRVANVAKFLILTFASVDFISIFHPADRTIPFLLLTIALSAPFLVMLAMRGAQSMRSREPLMLALTVLMAASPHLLTVFSTMHAYAALGLVALLVGRVIDHDAARRRTLAITFALYMLSALMVDARHYMKAYRSGITGRQMADAVIRQAPKPARKAWCVCIDNGEQKYSSFCVIPYDAFGWGNAVYWRTRHRWPKTLGSEIVTAADARHGLDSIVRAKWHEGYDQVWVVNGRDVKVITP